VQGMASSEAHFGRVPGNDVEVRGSLAEGTPAFRLWTEAELPAEWRQAVARPGYGSHFFVAVELPDTPWGRCYYAWAIRELEGLPSDSGVLPVMVSSMFDFRGVGAAQRRTDAAECLRALAATGKPPAHFVTVMEAGSDSLGHSEGSSTTSVR
jgi:hypothetical protein